MLLFLILVQKSIYKDHYSTLISVAVTNTMSKSNLGRRGFIWIILPGFNSSLRDKKAGTQAGAEEGIMKKCCLLACSLWIIQSQLSYTTPDLLSSVSFASDIHTITTFVSLERTSLVQYAIVICVF